MFFTETLAVEDQSWEEKHVFLKFKVEEKKKRTTREKMDQTREMAVALCQKNIKTEESETALSKANN